MVMIMGLAVHIPYEENLAVMLGKIAMLQVYQGEFPREWY